MEDFTKRRAVLTGSWEGSHWNCLRISLRCGGASLFEARELLHTLEPLGIKEPEVGGISLFGI